MKLTRDKICLYTSVVDGDNTMYTTISEAERLGVGGVEFMNFCDELKTPDMNEAKKLASLAKERSLKIPCFSVAGDILTEPEVASDRIKAYTDICSELEIPLLHHTVAIDYTAWDIDDNERARRFDFCKTYALMLSDYAKSRGVTTVIEDQGFVFNGVKNCEKLCALSGDNIGIVADTGNIMFFDEKPADFIRAMDKRVLHAHVKDYYLTKKPMGQKCYRTKLSNYLTDAPLGKGQADIKECMKAFSDIGYSGMYSLEFSKGIEGCSAEQTIKYLEGE